MPFTAILPKRKPNVADIKRQILTGMRGVANDVQKDFKKTTATWGTTVQFITAVGDRGGEITFQVYTTNQIYAWVNNGTGAHGDRNSSNWYPIVAHGKSLKFQGEFNPKTSQGVIESRPGGKFGAIVMPIAVRHPGIKPRYFEGAVKDKWEPLFKGRMQAVFDALAKNL